MNLWFFIDYAYRDLFKSKVMFFLIVASISVAAVALLATSSILSGFSSALRSGNDGWLSDLVVLSDDKDRSEIIQSKAVIEKMRSVKNVKAVSLRSYGTGALRTDEKWAAPFKIMGADFSDEEQATRLKQNLIKGRFIEQYGPRNEMVIGKDFANTLVGGLYDNKYAEIGDVVELRNEVGEIKKYDLVGILDGKTFFPNSIVFLDKDEVEGFVMGTKNVEVVIKLFNSSEKETLETKATLQAMFPTLLVNTSEEAAGFVKDILNAISYIVGTINTLLIFVVFFIVNIVMYINVSQEKRNIGILKSLGCSDGFIIALTLFRAVFFALIAYSIGFFIYLVLYGISSQNPYPLLIGDFQMVIESNQVLLSLLLVSFSVFLGSIIPAYIAARTNIIDVLRSE